MTEERYPYGRMGTPEMPELGSAVRRGETDAVARKVLEDRGAKLVLGFGPNGDGRQTVLAADYERPRARAVGECLDLPRIEPVFDPVQELIDEAEIQARDRDDDDDTAIVDADERLREYAKWRESPVNTGLRERNRDLAASVVRLQSEARQRIADEYPPTLGRLVAAFAEGLAALALRRLRR